MAIQRSDESTVTSSAGGGRRTRARLALLSGVCLVFLFIAPFGSTITGGEGGDIILPSSDYSESPKAEMRTATQPPSDLTSSGAASLPAPPAVRRRPHREDDDVTYAAQDEEPTALPDINSLFAEPGAVVVGVQPEKLREDRERVMRLIRERVDRDINAARKAAMPLGRLLHVGQKVLHPYHGAALDAFYGNKPIYDGAMCELALIHSGNCGIEEGVETWVECVRRLGAEKLTFLMPRKCLATRSWRTLLDSEKSNAIRVDDVASDTLRRGFVYSAETYINTRPTPLPVSPRQRRIASYVPPRICRSGCKQYPISFGVPEANIAPKVSREKWWGFLPYIPGQFPFSGKAQYSFDLDDEWLKDQLHQHSFFAWTHKRGGWDCMRHLEILSAGAIPYFADLELCPLRTLGNYPKALIREAMELAGLEHVGRVRRGSERIDNEFMSTNAHGHLNFKKPGAIDLPNFPAEKYFEIADRILNHTRHHMTTAATVAYVLRTIGYEEPKHVIMIGRWTYDYLHQTVESGLSDLGIKTTVLGHTTDWALRIGVREPVAETQLEDLRRERANRANHKVIPGLAWMYGFRSDPRVINHTNADRNDATIQQRILAGEFDLVIYSYTENEPISKRWYWNEISKAIPKERRVFLHHNDDAQDPDRGSEESCHHGWLFKREMRDVTC
jgi:hypothetical protein